jgi:hypothetical protein
LINICGVTSEAGTHISLLSLLFSQNILFDSNCQCRHIDGYRSLKQFIIIRSEIKFIRKCQDH